MQTLLFKPQGTARLTLLGRCMLLLLLLFFGHVSVAIGKTMSFLEIIKVPLYLPVLLSSMGIIFCMMQVMVVGLIRSRRIRAKTKSTSKSFLVLAVYCIIIPIALVLLFAWIFFKLQGYDLFHSTWFARQGWLAVIFCIAGLGLVRQIPDYTDYGATQGAELEEEPISDQANYSAHYKNTKNMLYSAKDKATLIIDAGGKETIKRMPLTELTNDLPPDLYFVVSRFHVIHKDNIKCAYYNGEKPTISIDTNWGPNIINVPEIRRLEFNKWMKERGRRIIIEKPEN